MDDAHAVACTAPTQVIAACLSADMWCMVACFRSLHGCEVRFAACCRTLHKLMYGATFCMGQRAWMAEITVVHQGPAHALSLLTQVQLTHTVKHDTLTLSDYLSLLVERACTRDDQHREVVSEAPRDGSDNRRAQAAHDPHTTSNDSGNIISSAYGSARERTRQATSATSLIHRGIVFAR